MLNEEAYLCSGAQSDQSVLASRSPHRWRARAKDLGDPDQHRFGDAKKSGGPWPTSLLPLPLRTRPKEFFSTRCQSRRKCP